MAFTDFKSISQVQQEYNILYDEQDFIQPQDVTPSPTFLAEFEFNWQHIDMFTSEAARCENVIYPILREVYKSYADQYSLWSHKSMSYDETLTGTPDYIVTTKSPLGKTVFGLPIVIISEAKQSDFVQGWGQCLAEMVAAQKINQNTEQPVYGIVSDGELWQFGRLVGNQFTKHKTRLALTDTERLFGALAYLFAAR